MNRLLIVCPTVTGREESLARLIDSYERTIPSGFEVEFLTPTDRQTVGEGWVDGSLVCAGEDFHYIHFTCDDLEAVDGWLEAACEAVDQGFQPAPYLDTFGQINYGHPPTPELDDWKPTNTSVIPFFSGEWMHIIDQYASELSGLHYFSDDLISSLFRLHGIATKCRIDYKFLHHHEMHKRGAGMTQDERMHSDMAKFNQIMTGIMS